MVLLSQKVENGEEAVNRIKEITSGEANIEFIECDLGNLAQVKAVGDRIRQNEQRLDIVSSFMLLSSYGGLNPIILSSSVTPG